MPVAGSAYTFSYASLGEIVAWIIGWDLILELALGAATVSVGWSQYFVDVLNEADITVPSALYGEGHNLIAAAIVLILTAVICVGIRVSSGVNFVMVVIKVGIVLLVIIAGLFFIDANNWSPFIPESGSPGAEGVTITPSLLQDMGFSPGAFGVSGIFTGAALVFFAYIGFDVVATAAEETKKPKRDMPIGILSALGICTFLYICVSLVVTGMVKYTEIDIEAPLAAAFRSVGHPGIATTISVGALLGLTTVMLILLLGQSRVFFAMSRDRLLPAAFARDQPSLRHAGPHVGDHGRRRGGDRSLGTPHRAGRAGQHRHLVRLRAGGHRRDRAAADASRPRARLPVPRGAGRADPGGSGVDLPDAQPARRHLVAVRGVDGDRTGRLLRVRRPPQPAGHRPQLRRGPHGRRQGARRDVLTQRHDRHRSVRLPPTGKTTESMVPIAVRSTVHSLSATEHTSWATGPR